MQAIKKPFKSPIFLVIFSLVIGVVFVGGGYLYSKYILKTQDLSVLEVTPQVADSCKLNFTVGHDSTAPVVECQKLINGVMANPVSNAVSIEKGQTFKYKLRLTNKSTTKDYKVQNFIDKFIVSNSGFVELKSITIKPTGVTCTISTDNKQVGCDFSNYVLVKGTSVDIEIDALALENTTQTLENQFTATVLDQTTNVSTNVTCPAFVNIVPKVFTALSCEKTLAPDTVKVGDTVTASIKVKTRTISSDTQLQAGEVMVDALPSNLTFTVKDPLYFITALANTNINWLTGPVIDSSVTSKCSLVAETGGNSINCNYSNYNASTNGGIVLPFTATVGASAIVGQNIKNVVQVIAGNKTAICSDTVAIAQTTTQVVSCTKMFLDANENPIANGTKIKQGSRVVSRITITNTGNTALSNLSVDDPLNNTYSSQGASNLNYLTYKEMRNGTPSQITQRCTFSTDMRAFTCNYADSESKEPIVVAPGVPLNIDTVVEVNSNVKLDSTIVNVAKVFDVANPSISVFCKDDIVGTIKDEPKKQIHTQCQNMACVEVDGEGDDRCTNDKQCSLGYCENASCKQKTCEDGDCKTTCVDDIDCAEETETHLSCQNQSCVVVSGAGSNQCANNTDCTVLSSTAPIAQVPDTGAFERTIAITVFASALIFLGIALSML